MCGVIPLMLKKYYVNIYSKICLAFLSGGRDRDKFCVIYIYKFIFTLGTYFFYKPREKSHLEAISPLHCRKLLVRSPGLRAPSRC